MLLKKAAMEELVSRERTLPYNDLRTEIARIGCRPPVDNVRMNIVRNDKGPTEFVFNKMLYYIEWIVNTIEAVHQYTRLAQDMFYVNSSPGTTLVIDAYTASFIIFRLNYTNAAAYGFDIIEDKYPQLCYANNIEKVCQMLIKYLCP